MIRLASPAAPSRRHVFFFFLFALILGACDAPTIPAGTPGSVEVLAFIDEDGSGVFSPATDAPLAGVQMQLVGPGGSVVGQATTDQEGRAHFSEVVPGGYSVELAGPVPTGLELTTARRPVVSIPAQGGSVQTTFRFVAQPSALEGVVYRDVSGSGNYDPNLDEPGEGFLVELFRGDAAEGEPQAETRSGEDGSFAFPFLRSGSWTVRITPPPPLELVGEPVRSVSLSAGATSRLEVAFVGQSLLDIADARLLSANTPVTVEGVVMVNEGAFAARNVFIQDQTGGILVFIQAADQALGLKVGDSVQVSGDIRFFNDEIQISNNPTVEVLGTGTPPAPRVVSGAEVLARTFEGELAALGTVTVDSIQAFTTASNVFVTTEDGSNVILRSDNRTGLTADDWVTGEAYQVNGILRSFRGTPQVFPRGFADVVPVGGTVSVSRARNFGLNTPVIVEGTVMVDEGAFAARNIFVQDGTGGILVFIQAADRDLGLTIGDSIRVSGDIRFFNDEIQISNDPTVEVLGAGTPPAPRVVSGAEVLARTFEGELAALGTVTVDSIQSFTTASNVFVTTEDGSNVILRSDNRTGIAGADWTEGASYQVTGILRSFRGTPQVFPRRPADVTPASAGRTAMYGTDRLNAQPLNPEMD